MHYRVGLDLESPLAPDLLKGTWPKGVDEALVVSKHFRPALSPEEELEMQVGGCVWNGGV